MPKGKIIMKLQTLFPYKKCPNEARKILKHPERNGSRLEYRFENLSVSGLDRLIKIKAINPESYWTGRPRVIEMLKFGKKNPGTLFCGFRVSDKENCRGIVVERVCILIENGMVPVKLLFGFAKRANLSRGRNKMLIIDWGLKCSKHFYSE